MTPRRIHHVLLLSVDGLHAVDLSRYVAGHPASTLAQLSRQGTTFIPASTASSSRRAPDSLVRQVPLLQAGERPVRNGRE